MLLIFGGGQYLALFVRGFCVCTRTKSDPLAKSLSNWPITYSFAGELYNRTKPPKFPCPHCSTRYRRRKIHFFQQRSSHSAHLRAKNKYIIASATQGATKTDANTSCSANLLHLAQLYPPTTFVWDQNSICTQIIIHMRRTHNYSPFPYLVKGCPESC